MKWWYGGLFKIHQKEITFRYFYKKLELVSVVPEKAGIQAENASKKLIANIVLGCDLTFLITWNFIFCLDPGSESGTTLAGTCFS